VGAVFIGIVSFSEAQSLTRSFAGSLVLLKSGDTLRGPLTYLPEQEMIIVTMPDLTRKAFTSSMLRAFVVKGEISGYSLAGKALSKLAEPSSHAGGLAALYSNPASPVLESYLEKGRNRVFITYKLPTQQVQRRHKTAGFFEVLAPGNVMLLQREIESTLNKERISYERQVTPPIYQDGKYVEQPIQLIAKKTVERSQLLKPLLYLSLPNQELILLRNPRKDLLSHFTAQQERILAFVISRQLSWDKPADVAQIVNFLNAF
jgi:hypothetical protein